MNRSAQIQSQYILVTIMGLLIALLSGCATVDISLLPMYGGVEKTAKQKQADEAYFNRMDANFEDRKAASESAANNGWNYLNNRNWQTAMRRFNQAWLLDPENYMAYWGFVAILRAQDKYRESSDMVDIALKLAPDNHRLMCDATISYGSYAHSITFNSKEKEKYLQKAMLMSEKAVTIAPAEPCIYRTWAVTLFYSGQYLAAWEKVRKYEELGYHYPQNFINNLTEKMPRPVTLK